MDHTTGVTGQNGGCEGVCVWGRKLVMEYVGYRDTSATDTAVN